MVSLEALGLNEPFKNPTILSKGVSIHEWLIDRIKSDNLTHTAASNGLLYDLNEHVPKRSIRHAQLDPTRELSKRQMAHILCFLISRMRFEEVTNKIVRSISHKFPKGEPPTALWKSGIDYIQKIGNITITISSFVTINVNTIVS